MLLLRAIHWSSSQKNSSAAFILPNQQLLAKTERSIFANLRSLLFPHEKLHRLLCQAGEKHQLSWVVITINLKLWARAAFHEPRAFPCRNFNFSEGCHIRDELPGSQQQVCCNNSVDQIKFLFTAQSQKLFLIAALRGIFWLIVNVLSNVLLYKSLPMFEISSFLLLSSENVEWRLFTFPSYLIMIIKPGIRTCAWELNIAGLFWLWYSFQKKWVYSEIWPSFSFFLLLTVFVYKDFRISQYHVVYALCAGSSNRKVSHCYITKIRKQASSLINCCFQIVVPGLTTAHSFSCLSIPPHPHHWI